MSSTSKSCAARCLPTSRSSRTLSQAHGATFHGRPVGALADLAAFSFYPTKNLGALGDAGAVVCRDADVAARCALRQYGWQQRYVAEIPGGRNSRIDELQAAFVRAAARPTGREPAKAGDLRVLTTMSWVHVSRSCACLLISSPQSRICA